MAAGGMAAGHSAPEPLTEQEIGALFQALDRDGNGEIGLSDARASFEGLGAQQRALPTARRAACAALRHHRSARLT